MVDLKSHSFRFHLNKKNEANPIRHILLFTILIICTSAGSAQAEQEIVVSFDASEKLSELALIPEGIMVFHTPDPVHYTLYSHTISGVRWQYSTTVSSMGGPVTIIEFGYFVERNGQWEFSYGEEVPYIYSSYDFAEKYNCPNSVLHSGESYTDTRNQSIIDCVPEQVVKWYFIGVDAEGKRVKGEANVKLLAELNPSKHGSQN